MESVPFFPGHTHITAEELVSSKTINCGVTVTPVYVSSNHIRKQITSYKLLQV